jgi:hypothetical protein
MEKWEASLPKSWDADCISNQLQQYSSYELNMSLTRQQYTSYSSLTYHLLELKLSEEDNNHSFQPPKINLIDIFFL